MGRRLVDEVLASGRIGPYVLQAAIAACHARARTRSRADGPLKKSSVSEAPIGSCMTGCRRPPTHSCRKASAAANTCASDFREVEIIHANGVRKNSAPMTSTA